MYTRTVHLQFTDPSLPALRTGRVRSPGSIDPDRLSRPLLTAKLDNPIHTLGVVVPVVVAIVQPNLSRDRRPLHRGRRSVVSSSFPLFHGLPCGPFKNLPVRPLSWSSWLALAIAFRNNRRQPHAAAPFSSSPPSSLRPPSVFPIFI
jgi:hypothetical protein